MEIYCEATIHRQITPNPDKIKQLFLALFLLPLFLGVMFTPWFFVPAGIMGLMYWWTVRNVEMEYDYLLVNHEFEIDRVLGGKSRRHILTLDLGQVIFIAPKGAEELEAFDTVLMKDFSASDPDVVPYIVVCYIGGEKRRLAVQFPDDMIQMIRRQIPDKVILK